MADSPLPQRHRKRRERQPQETEESDGKVGSAVPASTTVITNVDCDGIVAEAEPKPRERIDACEYFGVPSLVFDEPHVEHVDTVFRDFEPNVTSFAFEYLDHTADVQLHSWGPTLASAIEQVIVCMFNYMTDLDGVDIDRSCNREITATDECLFLFCSEGVIVKDVKVYELDDSEFKIVLGCKGEEFDLKKHKQGTEVKAITYSNMQVLHNEDEGRWDVYVIIDI